MIERHICHRPRCTTVAQANGCEEQIEHLLKTIEDERTDTYAVEMLIADKDAEIADLTSRLEKAEGENEQLQVQMAGVSVAALGWAETNPAECGAYGWSVAYQDVLELRRKYKADLDAIASTGISIERDDGGKIVAAVVPCCGYGTRKVMVKTVGRAA